MKTIFLMIVVTTVSLILGCSRKEFIKPEDTFSYRDRDIVVNLHDTTWVYFEDPQYSFGEDAGGKYIKGIGRSPHNADTMTAAQQETTIYFQQIKYIRITNPNKVIDTTLDILSIGVAVGLAGMLVLFLVASRIHHM